MIIMEMLVGAIILPTCPSMSMTTAGAGEALAGDGMILGYGIPVGAGALVGVGDGTILGDGTLVGAGEASAGAGTLVGAGEASAGVGTTGVGEARVGVGTMDFTTGMLPLIEPEGDIPIMR